MSESRYEVTVGGRTLGATIRACGDGCYEVTLDDADPRRIEVFRPARGSLNLLIDGQSWETGLVELDDGFEVDVIGIPHEVQVVDPRRKALHRVGSAGGGVVRTQMPGRVVRVLVAEGDAVTKGQPVVVVEAMKMENELKAAIDGEVRRVLVAPGELVEARAVLVELA